jgi:CRP/FNR family transcriptional regulator, dissimilatory nitrate respiration regulator
VTADKPAGLTLKKGSHLFRAGERPDAIFRVGAGTLKVLWEPDGRGERVLHLAKPGEWLGVEHFFLGQPYSVSARAVTDCVVETLDSEAVKRNLTGNGYWAADLINILSANSLRWIELRMRENGVTVVGRLAGYLLDLHARYNPIDGTDAWIRLPASKAEIASLLDMTAESLSRALRKLAEQGLIHLVGREVRLLDPAGLGRLRAA